MKKQNQKNKEKKAKGVKKDKKLLALKDFCDSVLQKYRKTIKAIWLLMAQESLRGNEFNIIILIDNLKGRKINKKELKNFCLKEEGRIYKLFDININTGFSFLSEYFEAIMLNKQDIFSEIKSSIALYDPTGFFVPLQELIGRGKILGTKENLMKLILNIKERIRAVELMKIEVLSSIYTAIIDAGQAPLIQGNFPIPIQKEVGDELEKNFVKKRMLDKRFVDYYNEIVRKYKEYEHGQIKEVNGEELDDLIKKAKQFIERMEELTGEIKK